VHLLVLPDEPGIAVVEAEGFGNSVLEGFEARSVVVRVKRAAAQGKQADNHAARAACLWRMRSDNFPLVVVFGLGGRYGTKMSSASGALGIFGGKLLFNSRAESGIEGFKFEGHGVWIRSQYRSQVLAKSSCGEKMGE
jgi:hypothetical protein